MRFENQVVVVTSAGSGIGYALAERFVQEGATVIITEINVETGKDAAAKLNATFEQLNVRDSKAVKTVVDGIVARYGKIDVWINNADVAHRGLAIEIEPEDWDADIGVMLSGAFYCAHTVGKVMLKQGQGSMVNVASVNGFFAQKAQAPSCVANAGLIMLTKVLASEWADQGVRVNGVAPGVVMTDQFQQEIEQGLVTEQAYLSRIPMGRLGELNEVVEAVTFLASSEASFMTGEVMKVDGGWTSYHLFYPYETAFATAGEV